jgi:hypothetical protein
MFRSVRKPYRSVALTVDALEERSTPAALIAPIQPPLVVTLAPVQVGHDATVLVRTDLFGGGHGDAAPVDDLLGIQQSAFDGAPTHRSDADSAAPAATALRGTDDAPAKAVASEPIELCVVLDYD